MLADFLTMHERSHKPYDEIAYAFVGDGRFNMGRSLLVTGAIMGSDVRLVAPGALRPPDEVVALAHNLAAASGAQVPITDDVAAGVASADFVHADVWVSRGEPKEAWTE
jgi:ornithine carbamoyltransferase